ncbi:4'-phosphopantetheinyl transferase family protein [Nocardioides bizhenqiangii]|uniref:Chemotaxis protein CheY n=1 Tax=Nocardioides bizhenqiangii TaxID=3095076 RepID=A0ABZ0ZPR0_9ACTN|nr:MULTISPECIES: hypothetical protein [unclassified Nocardioides]MDZ5619686.1 hypothetical protein [Nocardioides sp. HM23]WQQ26304.1 hypothetical protein SHK19_20380 [Nocardioides sp. HM61]
MTRDLLRREAEAILCRETGAEAVARLCPRCGSSVHGRPLVDGGAHVSLSYARDLVAVAWSWAGPVGIDVELGDRLEWTRLEALLKAGGEGIADRLADPVDLPDVPTAVLPMPDGYVGTLVGQDVSWRLAGPGAPAAATST